MLTCKTEARSDTFHSTESVGMRWDERINQARTSDLLSALLPPDLGNQTLTSAHCIGHREPTHGCLTKGEKVTMELKTVTTKCDRLNYAALRCGEKGRQAMPNESASKSTSSHRFPTYTRACVRKTLTATRHCVAPSWLYRGAQRYAGEESSRLNAEVRKEHAAAALAAEKLREEEAEGRRSATKIASLEGVLRSLGERNHALQVLMEKATDGHQKQMEKTAEARGANDALKVELAAARQAAAAGAARAETAEATTAALHERLDRRDADLATAQMEAAGAMAENAALDAAAAAAGEVTAAEASAGEHRREAAALREKLEEEMTRGTDAEGQATLWAAELEECKWRETAATTHAAAMEKKAGEFESRMRASEARIAATSGAEGNAAFRIATAERDCQSANERARVASQARNAAQVECQAAQAAAQAGPRLYHSNHARPPCTV